MLLNLRVLAIWSGLLLTFTSVGRMVLMLTGRLLRFSRLRGRGNLKMLLLG